MRSHLSFSDYDYGTWQLNYHMGNTTLSDYVYSTLEVKDFSVETFRALPVINRNKIIDI